MTSIGILSDTHGYLDEKIFHHCKDCDEIWHAGDFGSIDLAYKLNSFKPFRGVYGNIDGTEIRDFCPENVIFQCEGVRVLMTHIGGYPPRYNKRSKPLLEKYQPQLMITGHSHILKIMYDDVHACMHINPGAAGKQGWQKVRTMVLLTIDGNKFTDCKVIELGTLHG